MSTITTSVTGRLDALVDHLQRLRERVLADAPSAQRCLRIAALYEQEARAWSLLFERSRSRVHWREALGAEAYSRACARSWRSRAATEADSRHAGADEIEPCAAAAGAGGVA